MRSMHEHRSGVGKGCHHLKVKVSWRRVGCTFLLRWRALMCVRLGPCQVFLVMYHRLVLYSALAIASPRVSPGRHVELGRAEGTRRCRWRSSSSELGCFLLTQHYHFATRGSLRENRESIFRIFCLAKLLSDVHPAPPTSARSASPDCFRAVSVPIRSRAAATPPHPQPPPEGASEALDDVRRTRDSRAGERRARQSAKRNTGRQYTQHVDTCATSVQQEPTEYVGLRIQLQPQTTFHRAKRVTHGHHRLDPTSQHHLPHDRHKCGAASEPQQTAVPASVIK